MKMLLIAVLIIYVTGAVSAQEGNVSAVDAGKKGNDLRSLPEISVGEPCAVGQTYRIACNACRCLPNNRLVCSKNHCLSPDEMQMIKKFQTNQAQRRHDEANLDSVDDEEEKLKSEILITEQIFDDSDESNVESKKNKTKCTKVKKIINKSDKSTLQFQVEDNDRLKNMESCHIKSRPYEDLPEGTCEPGRIYLSIKQSEKEYKRCFCTEDKIVKCVDLLCPEVEKSVKVVGEVYPPLGASAMRKLSTLPHQAAQCVPGRAYMVGCNMCACLANGDLLCDPHICLSVTEGKRITMIKYNGKRCKLNKDQLLRIQQEECVNCTCVESNGKKRMDCRMIDDCVPSSMKGHAETDPVRQRLAYGSKAGETKCIVNNVYKNNCNYCICMKDGVLRCTHKGCLKKSQVKQLKLMLTK